MVIADNLQDQTFWIAYPYFEGLPSSVLIAMLFGYSMQIFADFAGYSLIAIGIAGLFGYRLKQNFNFPYISQSFSEFWRRWHISLSSFLKEYLYIPLGGNKKGNIRTYINLMIVMFLGGLWHGAAWSYAVWGSFHGIALAVERFLTKTAKIRSAETILIAQEANAVMIPGKVLKEIFNTLLIFSFVSMAWLLFKLPEFKYAILYLEAIGKNEIIPRGNINLAIIGLVFLYSLPVILYHAYYLIKKNNRLMGFARLEYMAFGIMIFLIITNSGFTGAFIYFQF
jgi:alginate O-acetyltransferase complex protein AlgI